jgi:Ser/Thr protein kinase RdoA (MazF antagonist)
MLDLRRGSSRRNAMKETMPAVLDAIAKLYRLELSSVEPLSEGNMNASYSAATQVGNYILRLAPKGTERASLEASMLILERHFSAGSRVVAPLRSVSGAIVESVRDGEGADRLATVLAKAPGRSHNLLKPGQIPDDGFRAYGASLAHFHENSLALIDNESGIHPWHRSGNGFVPYEAEAFADTLVLRRYRERMERCLAIAESPGKIGIAHGDVHFSNVIYDPATGKVTFCDFDNACIGPFAMDLAMLVFDLSVILQCPDKASETERITALLVDAYRHELRGVVVDVADIACFVDLLEASIYIDCYRYWSDKPGSEDWLQLFFEGRRERLARDSRIFAP